MDLRVGLWENIDWHQPFVPIGWWVGPEFPSLLPGQLYQQELEEGLLSFKVNVLYRPDLPKRHQERGTFEKGLEYILYITRWNDQIKEAMWLYDTWEKL